MKLFSKLLSSAEAFTETKDHHFYLNELKTNNNDKTMRHMFE